MIVLSLGFLVVATVATIHLNLPALSSFHHDVMTRGQISAPPLPPPPPSPTLSLDNPGFADSIQSCSHCLSPFSSSRYDVRCLRILFQLSPLPFLTRALVEMSCWLRCFKCHSCTFDRYTKKHLLTVLTEMFLVCMYVCTNTHTRTRTHIHTHTHTHTH